MAPSRVFGDPGIAPRQTSALREGIRVLSQAFMETEVAFLTGAEQHERTAERANRRNGYPLGGTEYLIHSPTAGYRNIRAHPEQQHYEPACAVQVSGTSPFPHP